MADAIPPLLESLPAHVREKLLHIAEPVEFPADARVFREGRRADRFWVIRSGSVRLVLSGYPRTRP